MTTVTKKKHRFIQGVVERRKKTCVDKFDIVGSWTIAQIAYKLIHHQLDLVLRILEED